MRAAVIFGLNSSERDLEAFRETSDCEWIVGLPASSSHADAIVVFGGDGTVHRHLSGLVQLRVPVLIVPCGSGNDFARALKLPNRKASLTAWRRFVSGAGDIRDIDLGVITPVCVPESAGKAHKRYFCCVGGAGIDAVVARRASALPRWLRGHGGYVMSLLPTLFSFDPLTAKISTDGGTPTEGKIIIAAFANAPAYGGGMQIAPRAKMDDGLLDVCIVRALNKPKLLMAFPSVYFGRHVGMKEVEYRQTPELRIDTEKPVDVYADGEYVCKTPVEVSVEKKALKVIVCQ